MFEFALSKHSFEEVAAKGDRSYLRWAYEMLGYWKGSAQTPKEVIAQLTKVVASKSTLKYGFTQISQRSRSPKLWTAEPVIYFYIDGEGDAVCDLTIGLKDGRYYLIGRVSP